MSSYAIGQLKVFNTDWMEEYGKKIAELFQRHGGQVIARSKPERLEGEGDNPDLIIVIEFPNDEAARAWYEDPENSKLVTLRNTGSYFDLHLVGNG